MEGTPIDPAVLVELLEERLSAAVIREARAAAAVKTVTRELEAALAQNALLADEIARQRQSSD